MGGYGSTRPGVTEAAANRKVVSDRTFFSPCFGLVTTRGLLKSAEKEWRKHFVMGGSVRARWSKGERGTHEREVLYLLANTALHLAQCQDDWYDDGCLCVSMQPASESPTEPTLHFMAASVTLGQVEEEHGNAGVMPGCAG